MKYTKTKKEFLNEKNFVHLRTSKDFELWDRSKEISIRDTVFRYKYPKNGYEYLFAVDSKLTDYSILYLYDLNSDEISFLDYLGENRINRLHSRLSSYSGEYEGAIKFFESVVRVKEFIKKMPSEELISDFWIYLEDSGYKIESISYGFLEVGFKDGESIQYNCYNIPVGAENSIGILIEISKRLDMKNKEIYDHLEEFTNRIRLQSKEIKKIEISNNYHGSQINISFNWSFLY